jgi:hypothetical protein
MKKYVILVYLISVACLTKAQDDDKKMKSDMGLLFFMGINNSSLSGDDNYNGSLMGFLAGAGIKLANLSKSWDVRSELLYSQQGGKSTYGSDTYGGKSTLRLNYINLGILAHYQSNNGFFAEAGLQPGLLVSAKKKSSFTGYGGGQGPETADVKKDLNSLSLGVPIGAGYVFKKKFGVSVRFVPGLLNINKKIDGGSSEMKPKNFVLSARISYFL